MDINYLAFGLISLVFPLLGYLWYHPTSPAQKMHSGTFALDTSNISLLKFVLLLGLSALMTFGFMNLVIHQLGFYQLFFTDIMQGSQESQAIVNEFLAKYGDKHRHFGHGVLHGIINAFAFPLPILLAISLLGKQPKGFVLHHFLFWLLATVVVNVLLSLFI